MVGRPRQFDREVALERAMEVFWARGYEAAGVSDLLAAMGINRGSMYDTFGDKRSLFLTAVRHYQELARDDLRAVLEAPGPIRTRVRRALRRAANLPGEGCCRGCLLTNSAVELAHRDPDVAEAARSALREFEELFRVAIAAAVGRGEIQPGRSPRALARGLVVMMQGLIVMAKTGTSRAVRQEALDAALALLGCESIES